MAGNAPIPVAQVAEDRAGSVLKCTVSMLRSRYGFDTKSSYSPVRSSSATAAAAIRVAAPYGC
jgi:hypothetical protein